MWRVGRQGLWSAPPKTANPFSPDNARMYPVIFAPVNPESVIHLHEIPKISQYLKTSKLKSLYNNVPFRSSLSVLMMDNMPNSTKKHCESAELSSSNVLAQISLLIHDVFHTTVQLISYISYFLSSSY